jgi:hypothetical protein
MVKETSPRKCSQPVSRIVKYAGDVEVGSPSTQRLTERSDQLEPARSSVEFAMSEELQEESMRILRDQLARRSLDAAKGTRDQLSPF